jgi:hypothetical protein
MKHPTLESILSHKTTPLSVEALYNGDGTGIRISDSG